MLHHLIYCFFFFNDTATTEIYTLSLHDALPIFVVDNERSGIGILTERDILNSLGANQDPDSELVANHRTSDVVFASPDWTLDHAAQTMVAGGFRHLVVVDHGEVAGLLSMRDIVRCWSGNVAESGAGAAVSSSSHSQ